MPRRRMLPSAQADLVNILEYITRESGNLLIGQRFVGALRLQCRELAALPGIGLFAPPFGVGYYAACAIGRVNPDEGIRPIWGYLAALTFGLIVVAVVPWLSIGFLER